MKFIPITETSKRAKNASRARRAAYQGYSALRREKHLGGAPYADVLRNKDTRRLSREVLNTVAGGGGPRKSLRGVSHDLNTAMGTNRRIVKARFTPVAQAKAANKKLLAFSNRYNRIAPKLP